MSDRSDENVLRIGLITDERPLPRSTAHALEQLCADGHARVVGTLVVERDGRPSWMWRRINQLEDMLSRRRNQRRWERSPLSALEAPRPLESASNVTIRHDDDNSLARWRRLAPDVVVWFVTGPSEAFSSAARRGSVAFDHSLYGPSTAGIVEFAEDDRVTELILRITVKRPDGAVHWSADIGSVITRSASWNEHRRDVEAKAAVMLVDALRRFGDEALGSAGMAGRLPERRVNTTTAWRAINRLVKRTVANRTAAPERRLQWRLRFAEHVDLPSVDPEAMTELVPPEGRYWADPFVVTHPADGHHIFFEDFDIAAGRGNISCARLAGGRLEDVAVVMEPDHHLSYPLIVQHDGSTYMVPESNELGRVELWRCREFPLEWERVRVLVDDVDAVDSTLLHRDDRWWLFTNLDRIGTGDFSHELHVYLSDDLVSGTFQPHPTNPVVTDARHARMGGSFITTAGGDLLRPAQLGGRSYGSGLHLMRVDELSMDAYRESLHREFSADWADDVVGVHHICATPLLTVMDSCHETAPTRWRRRSRLIRSRATGR